MIRGYVLNFAQYQNFAEMIKWCNNRDGKGAKSRFEFIDNPLLKWGYYDIGPGSTIFFRDTITYNWFVLTWT